mgnify:FL=1
MRLLIKNIFPNVILKCSKTGVKNCDKVARSSGKVGIYFENNGHGTVLKNENIDLKLVNYIIPNTILNCTKYKNA